MNGVSDSLFRLLMLSDSACPVGSFSFSNGLETAAGEGLVYDAATLGGYARDVARQSAFTDGVAALCARRSALAEDYEAIASADEQAFLCKLGGEARRMTCRMGRKASELAEKVLWDDPQVRWQPLGGRWTEDIRSGSVRGTWPAAQGLIFAIAGLSARELFFSLCYGAAGTVLNAALRCVKVSHYDTQRILSRMGADVGGWFAEAGDMTLGDMNAFAPQCDILASLHEQGTRRMFMN